VLKFHFSTPEKCFNSANVRKVEKSYPVNTLFAPLIYLYFYFIKSAIGRKEEHNKNERRDIMSNYIRKNVRENRNGFERYQAGEFLPPMTDHAIQRTAQRNISRQAILAALNYGKKIHRTGRVFFTLRKKDVADIPELESFAGTTILVGRDGAIVTAYANRNSHSVIKKKSKRRMK
jgi:hypothetical protein